MKIKRIIVSVIMLGLVSAASYAQDRTEYETYMESSGQLSPIYRGRKSFTYNFLYNGHCFWKSEKFELGSIMYNGKLYDNILINLDCCRNELLVKESEVSMSVVLDRSKIEWFTMGDKMFRPIDLSKGKNLVDGFYQVLFENDDYSVYKNVIKIIQYGEGTHNGAEIGYDDPDYRYDINDFFANNTRYYREMDGKIKRIGKGKAKKLTGHAPYID